MNIYKWTSESSLVVCAGCLDTLAAMQELKMGVASAEEETQAVMKVYSKEDYSVVNRFESEFMKNHTAATSPNTI